MIPKENFEPSRKLGGGHHSTHARSKSDGEVGRLHRARTGEWLNAFKKLVSEEASDYHNSSPILRGPNQLSHALIRVLSSDAYAALLVESRSARAAARPALLDFIEHALTIHASDRSTIYETDDRAIRKLIGQLEIWARELGSERGDPRTIRVALELALSEELASSLRNRKATRA